MLFSLKAAASELGVDYETARAWVHSGQLKAVRLAGRRRIQVRSEDIAAFISESELGRKDGHKSDGKPRELAANHGGQRALTVVNANWQKRYERTR